VRELNAAVRIGLPSGVLTETDARALPAVDQVGDDGVSLTITTHDPSPVITALAQREALDGLQIRGATLEDVFLTLTGREYRA
jgi:ABC-2 type transport system ATP-binding protein